VKREQGQKKGFANEKGGGNKRKPGCMKVNRRRFDKRGPEREHGQREHRG